MKLHLMLLLFKRQTSEMSRNNSSLAPNHVTDHISVHEGERYFTRSKGRVQDLPYIMEKPLEWVKKT